MPKIMTLKTLCLHDGIYELSIMPRSTKAGHFLINGQDYFFNFVITWNNKAYHYRLVQEEEADRLADFLPRDMHFDVIDGELVFDERILTDEGRVIAAAIWEGIKAGCLS